MSDESGLDVDLAITGTSGLIEELEQLEAEIAATATSIDDVEARLRAIAERLGRPDLAPPQREWRRLTPASTVDAAKLIDEAELAAIERRFTGGFRIRVSLDRYDVMAGVAAGLAAAAVDWFVVRLPTSGWMVEPDGGSALTTRLRGWAIGHDNPFSEWAKAPFDHLTGTGVPGMHPMSHRVQTFGHDPLLGLVFGTLDIMRGTLTGVDPAGLVHVVDITDPVSNPVVALGTEILHLLSDLITKAGLPVPGWSALMAVGEPGGYPVTGVARAMYLMGYDSWHFLTMSTTVATAELITRGYFGIRTARDTDYRDLVDHERTAARATRTSDHPRFQAISLIAHGIAAAGNLTRIAAAGWNPLALNYPQWLATARAVTRSVRSAAAPDDPVAQHAANRSELDAGWARLTQDLDAFDDALRDLS